MIDQPYLVVIENVDANKLSAFTRFVYRYQNKEVFQSKYKPEPSLKIVIQGLTNEESDKVVASAPIICYYLKAIGEMYASIGENDLPNEDVLFVALSNAEAGVSLCKNIRRKSRFEYRMPDGFIEYLQKINTTNTTKGKIIKAFISAYFIEKDTLDYSLVIFNLKEMGITWQRDPLASILWI